MQATTMEIISTLKELLHMHPLYNEQMRNFIQARCALGMLCVLRTLQEEAACWVGGGSLRCIC